MLRYNNSIEGNKTKRVLSVLKEKAKRSGAWWRLTQSERALVHLTIKLRVRFTSKELLKAISSIIKKLGLLMKMLTPTIGKGVRLAWVFSEKALEWGNKDAVWWRYDPFYIEYLGRAFI
jgi:hypothetical protein